MRKLPEKLTDGSKIIVSVHDFYNISNSYHRSFNAALKAYKKLKKAGYNPSCTLEDSAGNWYASVDFDNKRYY